MSKRTIYLVECLQIRRKEISVEADDENDAENIVDDMLTWGEIDFNTNSRYEEDFNILSYEESVNKETAGEEPYRILTEEEKRAAYKIAYGK